MDDDFLRPISSQYERDVLHYLEQILKMLGYIFGVLAVWSGLLIALFINR